MTYDRSQPDLEELQVRLETYGADMGRWPQAARARAQAIVGTDRQAARMLAEARALDAVLAHAPLPPLERRAALVDRILADAAGIARNGAGRRSGIVIPWPRAARNASHMPSAPIARSAPWRAAALLAASLALGVFIGALDLAPDAVDPLMEAVDFNSDLDHTATLSNEGLAAALDEDFL